MSPFLTNLLMFSPLLALAALILYILDRADNLRRGAGLLPETTGPPLEEVLDGEYKEEEGEGEGEGEGEEDLLTPPEGEGPDPELDPQPETNREAPTDHFPPQPTESDTIPTPHPQPGAIQAPTINPRARNVGAKKARSLARRDQRRAYHESLQLQQIERTRVAAQVAEEEEERLFEEKRRRALAEEEITLKRELERVARLEAERRGEEERRRDVGMLRGIVVAHKDGKKAWRVEELAEAIGRKETWVRDALRLEGLVGWKEGEWRMVTEKGWYVVVGGKELGVLYSELDKRGRMEWEEMARVLEDAVA